MGLHSILFRHPCVHFQQTCQSKGLSDYPSHNAALHRSWAPSDGTQCSFYPVTVELHSSEKKRKENMFNSIKVTICFFFLLFFYILKKVELPLKSEREKSSLTDVPFQCFLGTRRALFLFYAIKSNNNNTQKSCTSTHHIALRSRRRTVLLLKRISLKEMIMQRWGKEHLQWNER